MKIDPNRTTMVVEERLEREKDPIRRSHLENVLKHFRSECLGDIDGVLSTLSPKAKYIIVGPTFAPNGHDVYDTVESIRKFYEDMFQVLRVEMQYDVEQIVVDEQCIVTQGTTRTAVRGSALRLQGHVVNGDPDAFYMQDAYAITMFPFDADGLCLGERVYEIAPPDVYTEHELRPEDIGTFTR